jgi:chromosome segregation ATPase
MTVIICFYFSNNKQTDDLNENIKHLEMEKSLLTKKLESIEASLTRWIFRACDYKTDLQQTKHEYDEIKIEFSLLNDGKQKLNDKLSDFEKLFKDLECKYESEKTQQTKLKLQQSSLESDLEHSKHTTKTLNEKIEKLSLEIKNSIAKNSVSLSEHEKRSNDTISSLNKQIQSLNSLNSKLEADKKCLDKDNECLKKSLNEIKRKIELNEHETCDLKAKIGKYDAEVVNVKDLKAANEQLKSENQYFSKKIESLLNENGSIKKRFDANLLEKNSIKCKYEELLRDFNDSKAKTQQLADANEALSLNTNVQSVCTVKTQTLVTVTHHSSMQTDDFNYENLLKPIRLEYDQKLNDNIYKEELYKNEIEQLKNKLSKHDNQFLVMNQNLQDEFRVNLDIKERNDFLFDKCEKLKNDFNNQHNEFLKFKGDFEIEKEVLETTVNQQKKFIDYIITAHPEVGKKYKLFSSRR